MQPDPIADFLSWYRWRPLITKTFLTSSIILATIMSLGYLDIHTVYYDYSTGIQNL